MPSRGLILRLGLLALSAVISEITPFVQPYGIAVVAMVGAFLFIVPTAPDVMERYFEERRITSANTKYWKEIRNFINDKLTRTVVSEPQSISQKSTRHEIYEECVEKSFPQLDKTKGDTLVLLCLCRQLESLRGNEAIEVSSTIQNYLNLLGVYRITAQSRKLFSAYHAFFKSDRKYTSLSKFFQAESRQAVKGLQKEFIRRFSKDTPFLYIKERLRQSEELRKTLVELIRTGQLDTFGIKEEALQRLKDAVSKRALSRGAYLILGNKIPKSVQEKLRSYPNLGGFVAWSHVPRIRPVRIIGFIIKPDKSFDSPKEFFNQELQPLIPSPSKDMLLVIFSLDILNLESYAHPPTADFSSAFMKDCYATLMHITESYAEEVSIWQTISESKITTEELLSIIPFNIFVPGIASSERDLLLKNYGQIKRKLGVRTLVDWRNQKAAIIADTILSFGRPNYGPAETLRLFGIEQPDRVSQGKIKRRLQSIGRDIVSNSRKFSRSLKF